MNKKAGVYSTIGTIVVVILGLLVIALVIGGPINTAYVYVKEKLFGDEGIFSIVKLSKEEKFQPSVDLSKPFVLPADKRKAIIMLIEKSIECLELYKEKQQPIRCFMIDVNRSVDIQISEDDFKEILLTSERARRAGLFSQTEVIRTYYYAHLWNIYGEISKYTSPFYLCANDIYETMLPQVYITQNLDKDCPVRYLGD